MGELALSLLLLAATLWVAIGWARRQGLGKGARGLGRAPGPRRGES